MIRASRSAHDIPVREQSEASGATTVASPSLATPTTNGTRAASDGAALDRKPSSAPLTQRQRKRLSELVQTDVPRRPVASPRAHASASAPSAVRARPRGTG